MTTAPHATHAHVDSPGRGVWCAAAALAAGCSLPARALPFDASVRQDGAYDAVADGRDRDADDGPDAAPQLDRVASAVVFEGRLMVHARGRDGSLLELAGVDGAAAWTSSPTELSTGPSSAVFSDRLYVFALQGDGLLTFRHRDQNSASWSEWELRDDIPVSMTPSAVASAGILHVFVRGTDGFLVDRFYDGGWTGWLPVSGGTIASAPSMLEVQSHVTMFARDVGGHLVQRHFDHGWTDRVRVGVDIDSSPAAVMAGARLLVYATRRDGALVEVASDDHGVTWNPQTVYPARLTSAPTAVVFESRLYVLARGDAGDLVMCSRGDGPWSEWRSLGGAL